MSTKAIEEALDWVENYLGNEPEAQDVRRRARVELAAIRKAAKTLDRLNVGDFTYSIKNRGRVQSETPDGASTWEHPDVKAWSDASVLMGEIAKESP